MRMRPWDVAERDIEVVGAIEPRISGGEALLRVEWARNAPVPPGGRWAAFNTVKE